MSFLQVVVVDDNDVFMENHLNSAMQVLQNKGKASKGRKWASKPTNSGKIDIFKVVKNSGIIRGRPTSVGPE